MVIFGLLFFNNSTYIIQAFINFGPIHFIEMTNNLLSCSAFCLEHKLTNIA